MAAYGVNPNTNRQPERKRLDPVVHHSDMVTRKKPFSKRFLEIFFAEDAASLKDYIIFDCIIPSLRDATSELLHNATDYIFYKTTRRNTSRPSNGRSYSNGTTYVNYNTISNSNRRNEVEQRMPSNRCPEVILYNAGAMKDLKDTLLEAVDVNGYVTVGQLYDLTDRSNEVVSTDEKWGWTELSSMTSEPIRVTDPDDPHKTVIAYILNMPRPQAL